MIKRIIFGISIFLGGLILLVLFQSVDPTQRDDQNVSFVFPTRLAGQSFDIDSLRDIVGNNKGLPEGFELAALLAYAAYPELRAVRIDMELTQEGAPMESNFDIVTLFGTKNNRVYKILLNNAVGTQFDQILLKSLPLDAQVGILAHELGHVVYYHRLSTLQIGKWGLMYLFSDDFRAAHEKSTDMMPLYHGLGHQIYQYAYYVRRDPSCVALYEKYKELFIDKFYMTDVALERAMERHPLYR